MKKFLEELDLEALKAMLPVVAASALVAALLVLGVLKASGSMRSGATVTVAVFDVVKFANAQRAVASKFIGRSEDATEAGTMLLQMSKKTTAAIEKVAGPGTLVLVKQGVVAGSQMDITDAVLTELSLPTDVPTSDPLKYVEDIAPTMLMMPRRSVVPAAAAPASADKTDAGAKVLP